MYNMSIRSEFISLFSLLVKVFIIYILICFLNFQFWR